MMIGLLVFAVLYWYLGTLAIGLGKKAADYVFKRISAPD